MLTKMYTTMTSYYCHHGLVVMLVLSFSSNLVQYHRAVVSSYVKINISLSLKAKPLSDLIIEFRANRELALTLAVLDMFYLILKL